MWRHLALMRVVGANVDLELLQDGAPTLLLLLDGLITSNPDNERILMATTKAYGAYASILYEEGQIERAVKVSKKSKEYGINLLKQVPGLVLGPLAVA